MNKLHSNYSFIHIFCEKDYILFVFIRIFNFQTEPLDTCFHSVLSVVENNVNKRPFDYSIKIKSSYNGTYSLNLVYYRSENNYKFHFRNNHVFVSRNNN